jgi:hypothetical protein
MNLHEIEFTRKAYLEVAFAETLISITPCNVRDSWLLQDVQEHLKQGSVLIYAVPHTSMFDFLAVEKVLQKYLSLPTGGKRAWLASSKFSQTEIGPALMGSASDAFHIFADRFGVQLFPVVQAHRINSDNLASANKLNKDSLAKCADMLKTPGNMVCVLPEGTRVTTKGLLRATAPLRGLLRQGNTIAVPMLLEGIEWLNTPKRTIDLLNPFRPINIRIFPPLSFQEAVELAHHYRWKDPNKGLFTLTDALMIYIARDGLPIRKKGVNPRGDYALGEKNIEVVNKCGTVFMS